MKPKLLVIVGQTATGKSDLAVSLALKFNGEIISADSRQVYKGMDIGTGKITPMEMKGVRHHLIDVVDPKNKFTVMNYIAHGKRAIEGILSRQKLPIIVGGTGFYVSGLVDGIIPPDVPPNPELRKKLEKEDIHTLCELLKKLAPIRASTIDQHNKRRIIRAIEIAEAIGNIPPLPKSKHEFDTLFIGLSLPKDDLKQKIYKRLITRIETGMIEEAKRLHEKGVTWKRMDELGLEYRYLALYLRKKISMETMIEKLNIEIWHYARRQLTWFKRDQRIKWYAPSDTHSLEAEVEKFINTSNN